MGYPPPPWTLIPLELQHEIAQRLWVEGVRGNNKRTVGIWAGGKVAAGWLRGAAWRNLFTEWVMGEPAVRGHAREEFGKRLGYRSPSRDLENMRDAAEDAAKSLQ